MSTADLFVEAINTAIRLGWALAVWLVFLATVAAILVLAAIACGAYGVRVARGTVRAAWTRGRAWTGLRATERGVRLPSDVRDAPESAERRTGRRRPKWAHTQPINHEWDEAA